MSLPQSVRKQVQAADKHFETPEENPDEVKATDDSAPNEGDQNPQSKTDLEASPTDDKQPAEPPAEPPKDDNQSKDQDALYWKHRHDVIQGKYNKEVPALHDEVRQLKTDLADRDAKIQELETQDQSSSGQSGAPDNAQIEQFKEDFGEDLVDFVQRMITAKGDNQSDVDPNRVDELDQRVSRFEQEKQADAEARFWTDIQKAVPHWREINQDPKFHEFLSQFDPETGKPRQTLLSEAQNALDAKGVIDIFKLHIDSQSSSQSRERQIPEEDVEPQTTKTTADAPQGSGNKRIWTGADITRFYKQKASGRIDPKEAEQLEADIFAAQKEGRVR
jgi:hypothetical protein